MKLSLPKAGDADFKKMVDQGRSLAQIGVIVQLACFGLFTVIAIRFHFTSKRFASNFEQRILLSSTDSNSRKNYKYVEMDGISGRVKKNWVAILRVTNIASFCILVCNVPSSCYDLKLTYLLRFVRSIVSLSSVKEEVATYMCTNGRKSKQR